MGFYSITVLYGYGFMRIILLQQDSIADYNRLRLKIAQLENEMMSEILRPERILIFLTPGRLVCNIDMLMFFWVGRFCGILIQICQSYRQFYILQQLLALQIQSMCIPVTRSMFFRPLFALSSCHVFSQSFIGPLFFKG